MMSSPAAGGCQSSLVSFVPQEEMLQRLMAMGVTRNAATRGLYYTGNNSADLAAAWIFENQDKDLDAPLELDSSTSSEDDFGEAVGDDFFDDSDLYKMVFVVNTSLKMGIGKIAAQVAHASLGLYKTMVENQQRFGEMLLSWEQFGEMKIVLKGEDAAHLTMLAGQAQALDLPHYVVQDAGKTQVQPGSVTVLALMGKADVVNEVTGNLSLL
ncbi:hypothetical protein LSH36_160g02000 [Paralvinella palmiformis]|uniref:peptidyl-tRNA hydrolase n=1 Tax=Paralvinella palmiformis TaxID=53620 RepID=A0AAD9N6W4_9ANNE|nr:hypothetical protein LSH36_160g02000 [Paralvinella palmiformis]